MKKGIYAAALWWEQLALKVKRVGVTNRGCAVCMFPIQKSTLHVTIPVALHSLTSWISYFLLGLIPFLFLCL